MSGEGGPVATTTAPAGSHGRAADVVLVGAGPGSTDLLTLDAERALSGADVVLADRGLAPLLDALVADGVLGAFRVGSATEAVAEPTQSGAPALPGRSDHRDGGGTRPERASAADPRVIWVADDEPATDPLVSIARMGDRAGAGPASAPTRVVRLYGGDPWFHPAGDCERAALRAAGLGYASVPGVVEELALAAAAGIPLQVRTMSVTTSFAVDAGPASSSQHASLGGADPRQDDDARPADGRNPGAPALPTDPAHTLVVRTADLAATARRLAASAGPDGSVLDRAAAAVAASPGGGVAAVDRTTLGELARRAPAARGVLVVGLVAALDTSAAVGGTAPDRAVVR